ncbi:MAG: peptide deformylase [Candidatus Altimarinota bacterium]
MALLKVETGTDNQKLRQISQPVRKVDKNILKLIKNMEATMEKESGCGLAAPQVGELLRVVIVMLNQQTPQEVVIPMINPEIISHSEKMEIGEEGCLSVPDYFDDVKRFKDIVVKYQDAKGREQKLKLSDLNARVVQHEIDHLNGILFVDKLVKEAELKLAVIRNKEDHLKL